MSDDGAPYDSQPARGDAFGELSARGYTEVPGDHGTRLARMAASLSVAPSPASSKPRPGPTLLPPERLESPWGIWIALAASIAVAIAIAIYYQTIFPAPPEAEIAQVPIEVETLPADGTVEAGAEGGPTDVADGEAPGAGATGAGATGAGATGAGAAAPVTADPEATVAVAPAGDLAAAEIERPGEGSDYAASPRSTPAPERAASLADTPTSAHSTAARGTSGTEDSSASTPAVAALSAKTSDLSTVEPPGAAEPAWSLEGVPLLPETPFGRRIRVERLTAGCVSDSGERPVVAAEVWVESVGVHVATDERGCFELPTPAGALVAQIAATGFDTLRFDLTRGKTFQLTLVQAGDEKDARIRLSEQTEELDPVDPLAPTFPAFERYLDEQLSGLAAETLIVSFEVSRGGRPRKIDVGPGGYPDSRLREARKLLSNGPDWPTAYRRAGWRYPVRIGKSGPKND